MKKKEWDLDVWVVGRGNRRILAARARVRGPRPRDWALRARGEPRIVTTTTTDFAVFFLAFGSARGSCTRFVFGGLRVGESYCGLCRISGAVWCPAFHRRNGRAWLLEVIIGGRGFGSIWGR